MLLLWEYDSTVCVCVRCGLGGCVRGSHSPRTLGRWYQPLFSWHVVAPPFSSQTLLVVLSAASLLLFSWFSLVTNRVLDGGLWQLYV